MRYREASLSFSLSLSLSLSVCQFFGSCDSKDNEIYSRSFQIRSLALGQYLLFYVN